MSCFDVLVAQIASKLGMVQPLTSFGDGRCIEECSRALGSKGETYNIWIEELIDTSIRRSQDSCSRAGVGDFEGTEQASK